MRHLLTIIHYELLMQLKSIRFKGVCLLVLFADFAFFMGGMQEQEFLPQKNFLDTEALLFFIPAVIFAGLFSVGRIRTTGMHSILMVRPFNTFILMLGQLIAAAISCLIPAVLLFFPSGLLLRWKFGIDFPLPPIFFALLFYVTPGIFCILAVTIWIRTCFKNNLVTIIILGILFAGATKLGNSPLLNQMNQETRQPIHNFVPMLSLFSENYWMQIVHIQQAVQVRFMQLTAWVNFALSIVFSGIFLILACYHLRRTEPHRKVIGNYGRRWYHAPTFLKIACDLKIDPHMTWKTHLVMVVFGAAVFAKVVWPLEIPYWRDVRPYLTGEKFKADFKPAFEAPDANQFPEEKMFYPHVVREEQVLTPKSFSSKLTFVLKDDPKDKMAILNMSDLFFYKIKTISIDGKVVPYGNKVIRTPLYYLEGKHFASCKDGKEHVLTIDAKAHQPTLDTGPSGLAIFFGRGCYFIKGKRNYLNNDGQPESGMDFSFINEAPIRLSLELPSEMRLLSSPVPPVDENNGKASAFKFEIPKNKIKSGSGFFVFADNDDFVELRLPHSRLRVRCLVNRAQEKSFRQLLEMAEPVMEEFCRLQNIEFQEDCTFIFAPEFGMPTVEQMKQVKRWHAQYRNRGMLWDHEKEQFYNALRSIEDDLLLNLLWKTMDEVGLSFQGSWDLRNFLHNNRKNGLNRSMVPGTKFQSKEFTPNGRKDAGKVQNVLWLSRQQMFDPKNDVLRPPIFQMLYYYMGHDEWQKMLSLLKSRLKDQTLTPDLVYSVVKETSSQPMDWFFDYWFRSGTGLPSFAFGKIKGKILTEDKDGSTHYSVEAEIRNNSSGKLLVPMFLHTSKEPIVENVWMDAGTTVTWKPTTKYLPKAIEVDARKWLMVAPQKDPRTQKLSDVYYAPVKMEEK